MKLQRLPIIKMHAILACFFLPLALLYFVSGALYSLDIQGGVQKQVFMLALERPLSPDLDQLSDTVMAALEERHLTRPRGDQSIARKKDAFEFRWGDLRTQVVATPTDNPLEVEMVYRQRSLLTQVMRVHRAEAGSRIRVLSLALVASLVLVLASGLFLAIGMPKLRRTALLCLGLGCVVTLSLFA